MSTNRCSSCGITMHESEDMCPFCGEKLKSSKGRLDDSPVVLATYDEKIHETQAEKNDEKPNTFSVVLFIVLLIVFWPAAIIYAIVNSKNN